MKTFVVLLCLTVIGLSGAFTFSMLELMRVKALLAYPCVSPEQHALAIELAEVERRIADLYEEVPVLIPADCLPCPKPPKRKCK